MSTLARPILRLLVTLGCLAAAPAVAEQEPGRLVRVGPVSLQINCTGAGSPTVVVETGLGDFAFDWKLVQERVERFARVCTYDRGGYASSELADVPRTFAQLNLELHELLRAAGEKPPLVLVGHSFGGAVVRSYAARYPDDVAGLVLVESVAEHQPLVFDGKPTLLKDSARGRAIPEPRLAAPRATAPTSGAPLESSLTDLDKLYSVLPAELQLLHRRFAGAHELAAAEDSQRDWSSEYFAEWDQHPQRGLLSSRPLVVITRAASGYDPSPSYSIQEVDAQRLLSHTELLSLSRNSLQLVVPFGHDLHLEAPDLVACAVRGVVASARSRTPLTGCGCG